MNKTIRILAQANAILFSFIIPFTAVYLHLNTMYSRTSDLSIVYAAETTEKVEMQLAIVAQARALAAHKKAVDEAMAYIATWSWSLDQVSAEAAETILPVIAQCESGNDPSARSEISSAKGWLQILDGTWTAFQCEGNVLNKDDSYRCGMKIATKSGLHHWDPSRACWSRILKENAQVANR